MTTNTTKLAEAIGILSSVMSSEIAQANHAVNDTEETVSYDDYESLRDIADNYEDKARETLNDIQETIELALDDANTHIDAYNDDWVERNGVLDDEEETIDSPTEPVEPAGEEEEQDDKTNSEEYLLCIKLKDALENVAESVNDLLVVTENFEQELEQY